MAVSIERATQRSAIGAALVFAILPTIAVCLRIVAARIARRTLGAGDLCLIAACILTIALESVNVTLVFKGGIGYHEAEIISRYGPGPVTKLFQLLIPHQILWALSLSLCKISLLLLYQKLFAAPSFIRVARATAVIITLWALATVLSSFLVCRPLGYSWSLDQGSTGGRCGNRLLFLIITGAINALTDVVVLVLPLPHLYKLELPTHQRLIMCGVFGAGLLTCVVSVMRIREVSIADYDGDATYTMTTASILGGLEPAAAVILACVPLLRPLLARLRGQEYSATITARLVRPVAVQHKPSRSDLGSHVQIIHNSDGCEVKHTFSLLGDNSSQWKLRPDGPENTIEIAASGLSRGSIEMKKSDELVMVKAHVNRNRRFINVSRDWSVTSSVAS